MLAAMASGQLTEQRCPVIRRPRRCAAAAAAASSARVMYLQALKELVPVSAQ
jgi:hypothetical protein